MNVGIYIKKLAKCNARQVLVLFVIVHTYKDIAIELRASINDIREKAKLRISDSPWHKRTTTISETIINKAVEINITDAPGKCIKLKSRLTYAKHKV